MGFYYCGRRTHDHGALHQGAERNATRRFAHAASGDVIGMLFDADQALVGFTLNGKVQGACVVPKCPLYLTTCLDREGDRVELRKRPLEEAPLAVGELVPLSKMSNDGT